MINDPNYIIGDQNVQVPAHMNYGKFMLQQIRNMKDEVALINSKTREKITYEEFTQYAVDLAHALHKLGVKKGDTVAFGSEKRNEFMGTAFAIICTGATFTPIEFLCGRATLLQKTTLTQPKYFICSSAFWDLYKDTLKSIECIQTIIYMDERPDFPITFKSLIKESVDVKLFEPIQVAGQSDVALVLYSSGTTGPSKGIMLTHANCILNSNPDDFKDESLKVAWIFATWYHNYNFFTTFRFITSGKTIVFHPETSTEILVRDIKEYKVNIAFLIPSWVVYLSKYEGESTSEDFNSLKVIYSRSCPLHAKIVDKVKEKFPSVERINQGYGMSEHGELASEIWGTKGPKPGSVGMPSPSITLKIADVNTRKPLGPNQQGEICVRGPMFMKGYIGINSDTIVDDEGFFKTGDLGYYDEDHYFYVIDRIKDVILHDGFKVAPVEIESILLLHPGVREVGVVGRPHSDTVELPTAFVVRQPDHNVTDEELIKFVAREMPPYMHLKGGVIFIDELPMNQRLKVLRRRLREILEEMSNQSKF